MVTDAYQRKCAVTGERTLPALEAAHIKPFAEGGSHNPQNGLLLRRDIHALFDGGYVTVTPLQYDLTHYPLLRSWQSKEWQVDASEAKPSATTSKKDGPWQ